MTFPKISLNIVFLVFMLVFMTIPSLVQSIDVKRQGTFENRFFFVFFSFLLSLSQSLSLYLSICVGCEERGLVIQKNQIVSCLSFTFIFEDVFD